VAMEQEKKEKRTQNNQRANRDRLFSTERKM